MAGLFVILTPLTQLFPTHTASTPRPGTLSPMLIFYLLWQLQSKLWRGDPWLLTQQAAQLWHKHSTATGYIDPDKCSSAMSWAALWLVTLQNTGLLLADVPGSPGDSDYAYYCTLELLPLARANYPPLIGQGWVMLASDWLVLAWGPSLIGHYVLITSHGTR